MADDKKIGTNWQDDELDAIVADYFAMLATDLSGRLAEESHSKLLPDFSENEVAVADTE